MKFLSFKIAIAAPIAKVYRTMLNERSFREWTSEFNPTSYFEGSWEKGSEIRFIGLDSEGKKGGIVGRIKENTPEKFISIEYQGLIKDNKELTKGPEISEWIGSTENYTFSAGSGDATIVTVELEMTFGDHFVEYFESAWPRALNKLKEICERA